MAEQQRKAPGRPVAERYYAEYVRLPATVDSAQASLARGHQREGEAEVAADQRYAEPDEPGFLPSVGYVGVLFRLGPLPVWNRPVRAAPKTAGGRPVNET